MKKNLFFIFSILLVLVANIVLLDSFKPSQGPIFSMDNLELNVLMVISWFFIGRMLYVFRKGK